MNKSLPKALFFDLDNTFYPYGPCHKSGLKAASSVLRIKNFASHYKQARKQVKADTLNGAPSHNRLIYFQRLTENTKKKSQLRLAEKLNAAYWKGYVSAISVDPASRRFLRLCRQRRIKTVWVTNLLSDIQIKKLKKMKLDNEVDFLVTSEEAGIDKPDLRIFKLALKKSRAKPRNVWMIGDSVVMDIVPAKKLGMKTILFNRYSREKSSHPDMTISSWKPLLDMFQK